MRPSAPEDLEKQFESFRIGPVGHDQTFLSPYGEQRIVYAEWSKDYVYSPQTNEYTHRNGDLEATTRVRSWFSGI